MIPSSNLSWPVEESVKVVTETALDNPLIRRASVHIYTRICNSGFVYISNPLTTHSKARKRAAIYRDWFRHAGGSSVVPKQVNLYF